MAIIPSGGGFPGIIGEAELIAAAVASVAADKAASSAAAAAADQARIDAQADAGLAETARTDAQSDAGLALTARIAAQDDVGLASLARTDAQDDAGLAQAARIAAQDDAGLASTARIAAQADAADADAARIAAEADADAADQSRIDALAAAAGADAARIAAEASAVTAAAAVASMTVAPLDSVATAAQVVRGSDLRLGLRGGVACTVGGSTTATALTPVAPFALVTLGIEVSPLAAASAVRVLWSTGTGNTTSDLRLKIATDGKLLFDEGNGSGFTSSTAYAAAGARWVWCKYDAAANTVAVYADSSDTPVFTYSRLNATTLNAITYLGGTGAATAYTGTIRAAIALNFSATVADRIAAMRGEYPQAWVGGVAAATFTGACSDSNFTSGGGTIVTNSGGILDANCPGATGAYALQMAIIPTPAPLLARGRKLRLTYTLTLRSGVAPRIKWQQGNLDTTPITLTAGTAQVVTDTFDVDGLGDAVRIKLETAGASDFRIENVSLEILGAQILIGPQDWARTRGVDLSGNCNDLVYGTGVVAIEPATKVRVIQATAAGATVSAGSVATTGTLSGASYRDTKALAAMRQWDAVSANWRQARPANCAALQAAVTANGTPTVEAAAITGNAVISANAALNLIHHIN